MAQVVKRIGKTGRTSYLIRVSLGYGPDGKQHTRSMTWTPPPDMAPSKVERELQRQIVQFEALANGESTKDDSIFFQDFAAKWMTEYAEKQLKLKTVAEYRQKLTVINKAIGHIRLRNLRTGHLNEFYANLQEAGIRRDEKYQVRAEIPPLIKEAKITRPELVEASGLSRQTIQAILSGKTVSRASADALSECIGLPMPKVFRQVRRSDTLSANTVKGYHRVISSILTKSVKWGYIPFNPASNAELPKDDSGEAAYLDEAEARRLLELLQQEHIKYRAAITFDLLSGLRRGELLGLRWSDVDFDAGLITITQTSNYVSGVGLYTDTPKNKTSSRPMKLSRSLLFILDEYRAWQEQQQVDLGDRWRNDDGRVFTSETGSPLHPDSLSKWFHTFAKRNGFEDIHLHSLRHTYASMMISDGTPLVAVSRRLGHAKVSTTANIYSHVLASVDEQAAQVPEKFSDVILPGKH